MRRRPGLLGSVRSTDLALPLDHVWQVVASGTTGPQWYVDAAPFVFRGALDRLVGGRGRCWEPPGKDLLESGDRAGFWAVTRADHRGPDRHLVLEAQVRAPGRVLLATSATGDAASTRLDQTVTFEPHGALGTAYLLADLPAREVVVELAHRHLIRAITG